VTSTRRCSLPVQGMGDNYEFMGGGSNSRRPAYGAVEEMTAQYSSYHVAGTEKKSKPRRNRGQSDAFHNMLSEAGLGRDHPKTSLCCGSFFVIVVILVTAWMQTCVPFCGAKTEQRSGLWKRAWTNSSIPHDMIHAMDTSIDPCDDFYQFACGGFESKTGIKADQVEWARAWDGIEARISRELRAEVEKDAGMAGTFYRACMDTATVESLGGKPLKPYLDAIDAITDHKSLVGVIAMLQAINVPVYFDWQIMADPKQPSRYVLGLLDGGLTLPDAKMYTATTHRDATIRRKFQSVLQKVLELTGLPPAHAKAAAADAWSVERALSDVTLPDSRLREARMSHLTMAELEELAPGVGFQEIFAQMGAPTVGAKTDNILCKDKGFVEGLSRLLASNNLWAHKAYLRFQLAYGLGSDLSTPYLKQGLEVGHILTGVEHQEPRWRKCYQSTKNNLPDEVAKLFVSKNLAPNAVDDAKELLQNIRGAFRKELLLEQWMIPSTRKLAVEKLDDMFIEVGHGAWQDYSFTLEPHSLLNNTNKAKKWIIERAFRRLSEPVNRQRWGSMDPTQVDGSYARQVNGVFVPAGLLQKPLFDSSFPSARNYGSVGAVLGHEFTHGFDDVGRRYDMKGKLQDWWTHDDVVAFNQRAQCVVDLYDQYTVDGKHVNGKQTLAENIADAGGVKLAHSAWRDTLSSAPSEAEDQLFFLSWGQTWCSVQRKKAKLLSLEQDPHAPDKYRVNGPLSQLDVFTKAFQCTNRAKMNPPNKCGGGKGAVW